MHTPPPGDVFRAQPRATFVHVSTLSRVHAAQAEEIVDATAPARRATNDIGADAADPPDDGSVGAEGAVVGAVEPKALGGEPSPSPEGELVGATEYKSE